MWYIDFVSLIIIMCKKPQGREFEGEVMSSWHYFEILPLSLLFLHSHHLLPFASLSCLPPHRLGPGKPSFYSFPALIASFLCRKMRKTLRFIGHILPHLLPIMNLYLLESINRIHYDLIRSYWTLDDQERKEVRERGT